MLLDATWYLMLDARCFYDGLRILLTALKVFDWERNVPKIIYISYHYFKTESFVAYSLCRIYYKFNRLNFPSGLVHLIYSYLGDRFFSLLKNNIFSNLNAILCGIIEGSVLDTAVFNLYFDDIPRTLLALVVIYADNTVIAHNHYFTPLHITFIFFTKVFNNILIYLLSWATFGASSLAKVKVLLFTSLVPLNIPIDSLQVLTM